MSFTPERPSRVVAVAIILAGPAMLVLVVLVLVLGMVALIGQ